MRTLALASILLLAASCSQHRVVVPRPNPTGEPITVDSAAFAFGTVQPRTVAECNTNLINEVRIHQNLAQAVVTVLTLGIYMPTTIQYYCAKIPVPPPITDD